MIRTRVEIDAENASQIFWCTTDPAVRWNGWATPTFDRSEAQRVIDWVGAGDDYHRFIWTTDREGLDILLMGESDGSDEWWWNVAGDESSGYGIGAFSWTWTILEDEAPHNPDELTSYLQLRLRRTRAYCDAHNAALHAATAEGLDRDVAYRIATVTGTEIMEKVTA